MSENRKIPALAKSDANCCSVGRCWKFSIFPARALFRHRFSHCLGLPEKQTGIDFLSPRVFLGVPHWEESRVFHEVWGVCVYAFNYFPAAEVLFPIITRAFFDVEIITHTRTLTHRHRHLHTCVILWVIFKLFYFFFFWKNGRFG